MAKYKYIHCAECGRNKPHGAKGLCKKCYDYQRRKGDAGCLIHCSECGRNEKHHAKGLCRKCYWRNWRKDHLDKANEYTRRHYGANLDKMHNKNRRYREANPEYYRRKHYEYRYGITIDDYDAIFERQDGQCAICGHTQKRPLYVDHAHTADEIRGLLCNRCNVLLGYARDDINLLKKAIQYLEDSNGDAIMMGLREE